jgi:hypothetical protein
MSGIFLGGTRFGVKRKPATMAAREMQKDDRINIAMEI